MRYFFLGLLILHFSFLTGRAQLSTTEVQIDGNTHIIEVQSVNEIRSTQLTSRTTVTVSIPHIEGYGPAELKIERAEDDKGTPLTFEPIKENIFKIEPDLLSTTLSAARSTPPSSDARIQLQSTDRAAEKISVIEGRITLLSNHNQNSITIDNPKINNKYITNGELEANDVRIALIDLDEADKGSGLKILSQAMAMGPDETKIMATTLTAMKNIPGFVALAAIEDPNDQILKLEFRHKGSLIPSTQTFNNLYLLSSMNTEKSLLGIKEVSITPDELKVYLKGESDKKVAPFKFTDISLP
ncbi:MAG: hypothetical protein AAF226_08425 [Verrucomicrobiota bacterium]